MEWLPYLILYKVGVSTALLMGFSPMALSLFLSHSGDSPIVTPLMVIPEYLGQSFLFSTMTSQVLSWLSGLKFSTEGSEALVPVFIFKLRNAARSRATPKWDPLSILFGVRPIS